MGEREIADSVQGHRTFCMLCMLCVSAGPRPRNAWRRLKTRAKPINLRVRILAPHTPCKPHPELNLFPITSTDELHRN